MPVLALDRGSMHYEVVGAAGAPWVVILPGAFTAPWQYDDVRDHLAREFRVITLDYRGIASSENDLWHVTPTILAADVLALLDELHVEQAHVACISLGTFVLAELLHTAPDRVARCAVGAMPALRRQGRVLDSRAHQVTDFLGSKLSPHQILINSLAPQFWSADFRTQQPERYSEAMTRMMELSVRDVWIGVQQFEGVFGHDWNRTRVYATLPRTRCLFLTGDSDPVAPLDDVREHPLYSGGPTVVFRGSGHLFLYERSALYGELVSGFFATGAIPDVLPGDGAIEHLDAVEAAA
ncbi:MAG TPA: alpha/beta hydrolase [Nakamurella sp.]